VIDVYATCVCEDLTVISRAPFSTSESATAALAGPNHCFSQKYFLAGVAPIMVRINPKREEVALVARVVFGYNSQLSDQHSG
jgi:hypothetical protein